LSGDATGEIAVRHLHAAQVSRRNKGQSST